MPQVKVVLSVTSLACDTTTREEEYSIFGVPIGNNTDDEVYFQLTGNSSIGLISRRLPAFDDYYQFRQGSTAVASDYRTWTNQHGDPVGRPVLWAGALNDNEGAD